MIHTDKLTRHFVTRSETVEAVKGIDIDIAAGELVAFLGPNGAGKSTTLRMLTTLLPPTSGTATVAGVSITDDPAGVRARIGYIGQGNGAGHSFRVHDELMAQGRFYGMDRTTTRTRVGELLETLDLTGLEKRRVSTLSGGQRRRLDIALGLLHRPGLLFLDEPSTGMDPHNRANLWEHIGRLRSTHRTTMVLTTHYLEEADTQSERVIVIDHGEIIADDTATTLSSPDSPATGSPSPSVRTTPHARPRSSRATDATSPPSRRRTGPRSADGSTTAPGSFPSCSRPSTPKGSRWSPPR